MQFSEYGKPWAAYTSLEQVLGGLINGGAHILKGLITGKEKVPIEATCISQYSRTDKKKTFCTYWFLIKLQNVLNNQIYFNKLI